MLSNDHNNALTFQEHFFVFLKIYLFNSGHSCPWKDRLDQKWLLLTLRIKESCQYFFLIFVVQLWSVTKSCLQFPVPLLYDLSSASDTTNYFYSWFNSLMIFGHMLSFFFSLILLSTFFYLFLNGNSGTRGIKSAVLWNKKQLPGPLGLVDKGWSLCNFMLQRNP